MLEQIAALGREIVLEAGTLLLEARETTFRIQSKSNRQDLVTELDQRAESHLIERIKAAFPTHAILGEETGVTEGDAAYQWVIDPLDGTMNYAHRYPIFAVSIGFKVNGVTEWGAVNVPALGELYWGLRGRGAYLAERPLHVSLISELADAMVTTGFPTTKATDPDNNLAEVSAVLPHIGDLRRSGSAAFDLAQVAAGRVDAFWEFGLSPWDFAAGELLVSEAGGHVTAIRGDGYPAKKRGLVATNAALHAVLHELLISAVPA